MKGLKYIQEVSWEEVFSGWWQREAQDPGWIECATIVKGWPDWESWRRFMAKQFLAEARTWMRYRILDPANFLPNQQIGPFQGWHLLDYFKTRPNVPMKERTFAKAAELFQERLMRGAKIMDMVRNFPLKTELIGLPGICMEGSHRSAAVALAEALKTPIDFSNREVTIVMGSTLENDEALLAEMLKQGSNKRND